MHVLKAEPRTKLGKKVKSLRKRGFLPAVMYGQNTESQPIAVALRDFEKAHSAAGESSLITLEYEGAQHPALIHGIARDPLNDTPIHADFYVVRMDRAIRTNVPLVFVGESPAVKNEGGVLVKAVQEVEVEALPMNLPHELPLDVSLLTALGSHLTVKDVAAPTGVRILADPDEVVAVVEAPRTEEELKALEQAPAAEAPAEVKTEQEIKRAARAEVGAADTDTAGQTQEAREGEAKETKRESKIKTG